MATAPRVIGIIVCVIIVIASLAFIAPAAIGLAQTNKGKGTRIGDYLAVVLNNEVLSALIIISQINDRAMITGGFTQQSAEDLAVVLNTGSLPRPLVVVSEQAVDASKQ